MKATVSGSFHQAMSAIESAVVELGELDVQVLSPADPRVVDAVGAFYFVGSDLVRSVKLVQDRHLAAIDTSDLLWLCAPNGYLGLSAAMEIGSAQTPPGRTHFCVAVAQSRSDWHWLRQEKSAPQIRGAEQSLL